MTPEQKWWEPYAWTDRQRRLMELHEAGLSGTEMAEAMGVQCKSPLLRDIRMVKARAAEKAQGPGYLQHSPVSEPEVVKGTSTLYGADGTPKLQWVKTRADDRMREEMLHAIADALKEELPRLPPAPPPDHTNDQLVNAHIVSDFHLGALAWGEESGDDWDLKIAENLLFRWFAETVDRAPPAETGVLLNLGDFAHFDGLAAVTPTSHHTLDTDTRFAKLVRVMIRVLRRLVSMMLAKYNQIILVMVEGNHDLASSIWLREMLAALYEHEPRVQVDTSPSPYNCWAFGRVMLGAHHGHLRKNDSLPLAFAAKFADHWGSTTHRYIHTGHRHHTELKEHQGVIVEQHPTLAAKDAFSARGGYTNQRRAHTITYHREHGEVGRVTLGPEAVL